MTLILLAGGFGSAAFDTFKFDATVSLTPKRSSTITKHPVENGSTISDHVFKNNTVIDITGVITNNLIPTRISQNQLGRDRILNEPPGAFDRVQSAHDILTRVFEKQEIVIISTELDSFSDCIITSLNMPRNANIGDSLSVQITLEQIQIVSTEVTEVSQSIFDAASINTKEGGKSTKDDANPDNTSKDISRFSRTKKVLNSITSGD